jgi:hypothetical protein
MNIDNQFRDWWEHCLRRPPIPRGHVLKVNKALQGHPEAPRLWHKHIDKILTTELGFITATHEMCLYHKKVHGDIILLLLQVDDLSIASTNTAHFEKVRKDIEYRMQKTLSMISALSKDLMALPSFKHETLLRFHVEPTLTRSSLIMDGNTKWPLTNQFRCALIRNLSENSNSLKDRMTQRTLTSLKPTWDSVIAK